MINWQGCYIALRILSAKQYQNDKRVTSNWRNY